MSVDLPAPFSPIKAWISPAKTVRSTARSALMPKKDFETPRISRIGSFIVPPDAQYASYPRLDLCQRGSRIKQNAAAQGNTEQWRMRDRIDASGAADTVRAKREAARHRHQRARVRARTSLGVAAACKRPRPPPP